MQLAIVCTMINGFGRKGFYNSQEIGLARALAARGHTVTVYKGVAREETAEERRVSPRVTVRYIPMKSVGPHGYLHTRLLQLPLDALLCFADQQQFIPHIEAFCRRRGIAFVPYVGTAHSLHSGLRAKVMDFLFSQGTLRLYKRMPVLAKTEAARAELQALGVRDIAVAPVGLDVAELKQDFDQADRAALRRAYGFSESDVIICNVSRLDPEKRPLDLIDLLARIQNVKPFRLLMVGEGALRQALEQKIAAHGLTDRVTLLDRVPYERMWEIYTLSDYYVNLNRGEIFGMAVMEAVYYRASVAAIAALGPSTTLRGMAGHRLCADDDEIAAWLAGPYPSKEELRESSEKMARLFSWDRCAQAFLTAAKKA
ncbi:MAG: glycosyltransferase [Clostridia bacterium]|nr:glycosyltransferase [Clostridia bacterium]